MPELTQHTTPPPATPDSAISTILVIDDDAALRQLVARCLTPEGYAVTLARDGAEALGLLERREVSPGLVLLDWRMPMPGSVFVREYRALPGPHAPIIIVTASGDAAEAAIDVDAQGFLAKPFDVDDLLDVVGRYVRPRAGTADVAVAVNAGAPDATTPVPSARAARAGTPRTWAAPSRSRKLRPEGSHERGAALQRLATEVQRIREALHANRPTLLQLLEVEQHRSLTREEAARVRDLRWESARLHAELDVLRQEFEHLRAPAS